MAKRLLIIDDQLDIVLFLRDLLESCNFEVITAQNNEEALQILETQSIDGILLDLDLPVIDGLTILNHRERLLHLPPVIVISADPSGIPMIEAIKKGAQDYLFKPIDSDKLINKCRQLFE